MTVGIVGLGLIGGSFAKAYHAAGHTVLAFDTDRSTYDFAVLSGTVNGPLTDETLSTCDLILMAVIPSAAVGYLKQHAAHIGPKPVVIDCCGTKRVVCTACFPLAKQFGFTYLGGLDERLFCPRLQTPRTRIPAGSVGIGGEQTGIYPLDSPGGWQLIGRTPLRLFTPASGGQLPYAAGDRIRFVPITPEQFRVIEARQGGGV